MRPAKISAWNTIVLLGLAVGCGSEVTSHPTSESPGIVELPAPPAAQAGDERSPGASASSLTLVTDRSLVCMVNNQYMGQPQIPIEADGRTYYGCCEMCRGRLERDPSSRVALDPVTGATVDKSTAVIGRDNSGRTHYFESEQTFARFEQRDS